MKINELTAENVKEWIRLDFASDVEITAVMDAAKSFIMAQTALTEEEINSYDDLTIAFLAACSEFYDNRALTAENNCKQNKTVMTILDQYARNYL